MPRQVPDKSQLTAGMLQLYNSIARNEVEFDKGQLAN